MILDLAEISRQVQYGGYSAAVPDCTGCRLAKELEIPKNIALLLLTPCSPEPDSKENVFALLNFSELANRLFDTAGDINEAVPASWAGFAWRLDRNASNMAWEWAGCRNQRA